MALSEILSKLRLLKTAHPKPYSLQWLDDGNKLKMTKQAKICLKMGSYEDEVLCHVIPIDVCHILLGRPW